MPTEPKTYRRLTRNAAGVGTYSSLWLASDHLLIVASTGYSETYARIMLSDIKAFFLTPTGRQLWWGLGWGLIAAISGIRLLFLLGYGEPPIGSGIFFAVSALALILNWRWGGGCRVHVMTGVQNTVLPSLIRLKKTRAVLAELQPLIMAAQANRVIAPAEPVAAAAPNAPIATAPTTPGEPPPTTQPSEPVAPAPSEPSLPS